MIIPKNEFRECSAAKYSALKAGGRLRRVVYPASMAELAALSAQLRDEGGEFVTAGGMSNILVLDGGYDGTVISTKRLKGFELDGERICCGSGESLSKLIAAACEERLGGLEKLAGVPGTVGGALYMNSGCFGQEIGAVAEKVFLFDMDNQCPSEWSNRRMRFGYRSTALSAGRYVVIGACFLFERSSRYDITNTVAAVRNMRLTTQPRLPSLGSVFKKVDNVSAGLFIEGAGLKGQRSGGMEISGLHANFIVNTGGGSADDYLTLMELAERRVLEKYGIRLEREVKVIGKRAEHSDGGKE